jgi:hypothetical protein
MRLRPTALLRLARGRPGRHADAGLRSSSPPLALIARFFALGRVSWATAEKLLPPNSVGTKQLRKNAVISSKVKDRSLLKRDFKPGQLPRGATGLRGPTGAQGPKGDPTFRRTIVVSPVGTVDQNGTALRNAVAGITGSSTTHKFLVKIEPGARRGRRRRLAHSPELPGHLRIDHRGGHLRCRRREATGGRSSIRTRPGRLRNLPRQRVGGDRRLNRRGSIGADRRRLRAEGHRDNRLCKRRRSLEHLLGIRDHVLRRRGREGCGPHRLKRG